MRILRIFLLFVSIILLACNPDPAIEGNCDLRTYDGFSYNGKVHYCNGTGPQQASISCMATLKVIDSLFILHIVDVDSIIDYQFLDTALVKCVYWEGNENY